jgi:hypothetical protein
MHACDGWGRTAVVRSMKLLTLFALIAGLAACGDEATAPEQPSAGPLVTYTREGGYASQPQKLVIARDGKAQLEVRTGADVTHSRFTLPAADLQQLEDALDAARGVEPPEINYGCADCFEYSVVADDVSIDLDSVSYSDDATADELIAVVAQLEAIAGQ